MNMNTVIERSEVVSHLSEVSGLSSADVKSSLKLIASMIAQPATKVALKSTGTFTAKLEKNVTFRNPQTEEIQQGKKATIIFTPSKKTTVIKG